MPSTQLWLMEFLLLWQTFKTNAQQHKNFLPYYYVVESAEALWFKLAAKVKVYHIRTFQEVKVDVELSFLSFIFQLQLAAALPAIALLLNKQDITLQPDSGGF